MTETWQHTHTDTKLCPTLGYGTKAHITVTAGLRKLAGNARPYFSVTADIRIPGRRDIEAGGCMHNEIRRYWPALEPVIALHLSDDTGTPMHADANGWYFLAGYYGGAGERYHGGNREAAGTPTEDCLKIFAEHVRAPLEVVRALAESWVNEAHDWDATRAAYRAWLGEQATRWQAEADAARDLLDKLNAR